MTVTFLQLTAFFGGGVYLLRLLIQTGVWLEEFSSKLNTSPWQIKMVVCWAMSSRCICWTRNYWLKINGKLSHLMTKPTKWPVHPAKTHISLGICPVWSESLLSAWRKLEILATHWVHSEDSDHTGRIPKLIWIFSLGTHATLLVLSCCGSY